ncbi:MAG: DUF423 domain-containing protein [Pseudomonadota bacterium]
MKSEKFWLIFTSLLCLLCIAIGAFAAHVLQTRLDEKFIDMINTAVKYQMFSCGSLFALIIIQRQFSLKLVNALVCQGLGCIGFCFSLYLYAVTQYKPLVFITPIGGSLMLLSWLFAIVTIAKNDIGSS